MTKQLDKVFSNYIAAHMIKVSCDEKKCILAILMKAKLQLTKKITHFKLVFLIICTTTFPNL